MSKKDEISKYTRRIRNERQEELETADCISNKHSYTDACTGRICGRIRRRRSGTITIKYASLKKVGKNALKGIKAAAKIKVPSKKLSGYKKLFRNKGQGKKVKITKYRL